MFLALTDIGFFEILLLTLCKQHMSHGQDHSRGKWAIALHGIVLTTHLCCCTVAIVATKSPNEHWPYNLTAHGGLLYLWTPTAPVFGVPSENTGIEYTGCQPNYFTTLFVMGNTLGHHDICAQFPLQLAAALSQPYPKCYLSIQGPLENTVSGCHQNYFTTFSSQLGNTLGHHQDLTQFLAWFLQHQVKLTQNVTHLFIGM